MSAHEQSNGEPALARSLGLRGVRLANRIVLAAHATDLAVETVAGGSDLIQVPGERMIDYYAARARGGAGLIVVEALPVHPTAVTRRAMLRAFEARLVPYLARLVAACQTHGACVVAHLAHAGANADFDNSHLPAWSPSGGPSHVSFHASHAMTGDEIDEVLAGIGRSAAFCMEAGFDGVEIDAGPLSLFEQFLSPATNEREDAWGGDAERRMRFLRAALDVTRKAVGPDRIVGLLMSGENTTASGVTPDLRAATLATLDADGAVDWVHLAASRPPGAFDPEMPVRPALARLRDVVVNSVLMVSGGVRDPALAEAVVAGGEAELVGMTRALIADPDLPRKVLGTAAREVRPCIACNQTCVDRRAIDLPLSCLVNPEAGREYEWRDAAPRARARRVLVVGGGPAGLEAARTAAMRGHGVSVVDRGDDIGGRLRLAARQPGRGEGIGSLIDWYRDELMRLQVPVRLGCAATVELVREWGADIVVIATGSVTPRLGIQRAAPDVDVLDGVDAPSTGTVEAVLAGEFEPRGRILILDDCEDWTGIGTALKLAEAGHDVSLATRAAAVGRFLAASGALPAVRRRFKMLGVRELVQTRVARWLGDGAALVDLMTGRERVERFDALVIANTPVADDHLLQTLEAGGIAVRAVGDCVAPRNAQTAILEGRRVGMEL